MNECGQSVETKLIEGSTHPGSCRLSRKTLSPVRLRQAEPKVNLSAVLQLE